MYDVDQQFSNSVDRLTDVVVPAASPKTRVQVEAALAEFAQAIVNETVDKLAKDGRIV